MNIYTEAQAILSNKKTTKAEKLKALDKRFYTPANAAIREMDNATLVTTGELLVRWIKNIDEQVVAL